MENKKLINGLIIFSAGLFSSSISSFLEHFVVFGSATNSIKGFFDGLSVVAFGLAIFILIRSKRALKE